MGGVLELRRRVLVCISSPDVEGSARQDFGPAPCVHVGHPAPVRDVRTSAVMSNTALPAGAPTPLLTRPEAAHILKVAPGTLATWATRGQGPRFIKVGPGGRVVRYRAQDLQAYLDGMPAVEAVAA
ncbi:helix-turn-helix transcriptional regulator [Brachybacterium hainanense]|uniref:Helix-turn-helix transcriptional regulator n=1 Tax=Brachybacterium hainanense TaxID=1541174 RepID=A0ABV6RAK5_9MICO